MCDNLHGNVVEIENDFFGHGVSVAGLITGQDLVAQLGGKDLGGACTDFGEYAARRPETSSPRNDMTPAEVSAVLGVPVVPVDD